MERTLSVVLELFLGFYFKAQRSLHLPFRAEYLVTLFLLKIIPPHTQLTERSYVERTLSVVLELFLGFYFKAQRSLHLPFRAEYLVTLFLLKIIPPHTQLKVVMGMLRGETQN